MQLDLLDKFTSHLRGALSRSIDLAWQLQQESIPPLFLLISIAEQQGSIGSDLLKRYNISMKTLAEYLSEHGEQFAPTVLQELTKSKKPFVFLWPEFSSKTKDLIEHAALTAYDYEHQHIGTEHLLFAVLDQQDEDVQQVLAQSKTSSQKIIGDLKKILEQNTAAAQVEAAFTKADKADPDDQIGVATAELSAEEVSETPALDYFGIDLTSTAQQEQLDPVIGREDEIERVIHILSRRTKNNPVLIGEPGVGKTAIAEGLAKHIVDGKVPDILLHKRIICLDLSLVLAGTMYRGEFESRLKQVIEELKSHPDIILFIDEIHMIVGAGGVQGGNMDAANILKPALAKGLIRCIGATTSDEYRKHIENDPALERRFQPVVVEEPTMEQTVDILKGLRSYYETYHHIRIPDAVIESAVQWSTRYQPDKHQPDKTIDLIDEAGAKVHSKRSVPESMRELDRCTRLLSSLRKKKELAAQAERFSLAVDIKKQEGVIVKKMKELQKQVRALKIPATALTADDIAQVLSSATSIPVDHIRATGKERYATLETEMKKCIFGQDEAIEKVCSVIKRSYAGLASPNRPLGSFMLLGPSGVGKTELAKVLAEKNFGHRDNVIRVDMSEFSESFTVSKLIGAPAGYVGYNDGVKISDHIRRRPYSVVLFDEIEKAHPDIFNILLQVLDEGRLTDSSGRELNFRNAIVIFTSNIGIDLLNRQAAIGFSTEEEQPEEYLSQEEIEATITQELQQQYPQEFLNRIDHIMVFSSLTQKSMEKIVQAQFKEIQVRCKEKGISLRLLPTAKRHLATQSYDPQQGARLVRKTLSDLIEDPLADKLLTKKFRPGNTVAVKLKKDAIVLEQQKDTKKKK